MRHLRKCLRYVFRFTFCCIKHTTQNICMAARKRLGYVLRFTFYSLFVHYRKMTAPVPLADGTFEQDVLAEQLLDHAALHRADAGVLLGDIQVRAGEDLE